MVYAVAMKTIEHFEQALGRVALWAPAPWSGTGTTYEEHYVRRLRIYPHALREANAYYSPDKKALLFGYFPASESSPGENLPGGTVFSACRTTSSPTRRRTPCSTASTAGTGSRPIPTCSPSTRRSPTSSPCSSTSRCPEALRHQIARTRGDLGKQNLLGELAQQFGEAIGHYGALRSAIGSRPDRMGSGSRPSPPGPTTKQATEAHDRGAVLVAAVFEAFLAIYRTRSADLIRLATGGTGVLPAGAISQDLVNRLAQGGEQDRRAHPEHLHPRARLLPARSISPSATTCAR